MAREEFDLLVIGGGINGAAVARDAAMRGLRVALAEARDFAGATSSRSSKLIHGGFRYLPQGQFRLVYHAISERERLRHLSAPHLVHPIRFLFPTYRGVGFGRFTMTAGLSIYDWLAWIPAVERHRSLSPAQVLDIEPSLERQGLTGGALYYDAAGDDARITLENALDAAFHRAAVCNYASVGGFSKAGGRIAAAQLQDLLCESPPFELRARAFVNAAGPWVDDVRRMDDPGAQPSVRLTKGAHLVFPASRLPVGNALVLGDACGRIVFVMPYGPYVLVGTTDTDFSGDRSAVFTERPDVHYLLEVLARNLPAIKLTEGDVAASFAGLRALVRSGRDGTPSSLPREEVIVESGSGMLSVAGGKLTTHREIAARVVARVMVQVGRRPGVSPTIKTPLPGARPLGIDGLDAEALRALPAAVQATLDGRYGTRGALVARIALERPELGRPLAPGCPAIGAEVVHAIRNEMARSVADFLVRRTGLAWRDPPEAEAAVPAVARIMAAELGWDRAREGEEAARFVVRLKRRWAA
jgi:glycerol-3-phosphate dehydrogenase